MKSFYITTTLPYVNADPHVGFAMEIIRADTIARYKKLLGNEVFFNTGTDEHGMKIYEKAFDFKENPQEYVDRAVKKFQGLKELLSLSSDIVFTRTTDSHHVEAAQEFWRICNDKGYIYKKNYKAKYCVGCELERTDSEIENGRCFIHQNMELVIIEEENYFFKFSEFQKKLLEFYKNNPYFVIPDTRFGEIKSFVERGLEDFSISRLKSKMPWGIEVPGDDKHVMYVWFDALVNYISALGWPENHEKFEKFWVNGETAQYCGKDNLRQQAAMWQAMLMSVDLPNTHTVVINGFINSGGQKMSKSKGNVISPYDIIKEYGTDALRYYCLRELPPFEDSDMTLDKFKEAYNANLANGLGNLVSRIMKMASDNLSESVKIPEWEDPRQNESVGLVSEYFSHLEKFEINKACDFIWKEIGKMDKYIQDNQPFKVIKEDKEKGREMISSLVVRLYSIARMLNPILPETSAKIKSLIKENKVPSRPIFARKD